MRPASKLERRPSPSEVQVLDGLVGGLIEGAITQLRGPSSAGKTALCTQLAVAAARSGPVAYVDAEGGFHPERAAQMGADEGALERILVARPHDLDEQEAYAREAAEVEGLRLLVVDSAVHHYRLLALRDRDLANLRLAEHLSALQRLADSACLAVVVTNHVWRDRETGELQPVAGDILAYRSRCVLDLSRVGLGTARRRLVVRKHPWVPEGRSAEATLEREGLVPSPPGLIDRLLGTAGGGPEEPWARAGAPG